MGEMTEVANALRAARRAGPEIGSLPAAAVDAIAEARHGDPFAVLGPHKIAPGPLGGPGHAAGRALVCGRRP